MTSFADDFAKAVQRWLERQPEILLQFFGQRHETFKGMVVDVEGATITFRNQGTDEERTIDFYDAIVRPHSFSRRPDAVVCSFGARWENEKTLESMECVLTELRVFGTTN
jgi:hypothetical protein